MMMMVTEDETDPDSTRGYLPDMLDVIITMARDIDQRVHSGMLVDLMDLEIIFEDGTNPPGGDPLIP